MIKGKRMYAVVRQTENGDWLDYESLALAPEVSRAKAERMDRLLPDWAKCHPVVRIVEVEVNELATVEVL